MDRPPAPSREFFLALRLLGISRLQRNGGVFRRELLRDTGFRRLLELTEADENRLMRPCLPLWHWRGDALVLHRRTIERRSGALLAAACLRAFLPSDAAGE